MQVDDEVDEVVAVGGGGADDDVGHGLVSSRAVGDCRSVVEHWRAAFSGWCLKLATGEVGHI